MVKGALFNLSSKKKDILLNELSAPVKRRGSNFLNDTEIIDLNLKTNLQERLLEKTGENLREIGRNVQETSEALRSQGLTIKQLNDNVTATDQNLDRANKKITSLSWGRRFQLILLNLIAFLLFLTIVVLLIIKIIKK
jgi:hypothetical protein